METCKFENNSPSVIEAEYQDIDYSMLHVEQVCIPLYANPTRKIYYFQSAYGLGNTLVTGIGSVNSGSLTKQAYQGNYFTVPTQAQTAAMRISFYDNTTQRYAIDSLPLAALISPTDSSRMLFPAYQFHMKIDFKKSYIFINDLTLFPVSATMYGVFLNVYY